METEETFDSLFLNAPDTEREVRLMRADNELLLSPQVEQFCQEVVLFSRLPLRAYIIAFSTYDEERMIWIKPDHPGFEASRLLRLPEVVGRIKELRDMVIAHGGMIKREELISNLRSIAFDPDAKHSDRLSATKQLSQLEGFEKQPDQTTGGNVIVMNLPFTPNQLRTASQVDIKTIDGEAV